MVIGWMPRTIGRGRVVRRGFGLVVMCVLGLAGSAGAIGLTPVLTSGSVAIKNLGYDVHVRSGLADATMEVTFVADKGDQNQANLWFPLPEGAVLHRAEIFVPDAGEGAWVVAETLGRRQGQGAYENAVDEDDAPSPLLIQQIGRDLYRARVFPIETEAKTKVRLRYAHALEHVGEQLVLRTAMATVDAEPSTAGDEIRVRVTTDEGAYVAGEWLGYQGYPRHVDVRDTEAGSFEIALPGALLTDDIAIHLTPTTPLAEARARVYRPAPHTELPDHLVALWRPDLHELAAADEAPRNVVFVVDTSGSMSGAKMEETKLALLAALDQLTSQDRFGIVRFSTFADPFADVMHSGADVEDARTFVENLEANGATNMSAGLATAVDVAQIDSYEGAPIDLFLFSDGLPSAGVQSASGILSVVDDHADGRTVRIFGLGIGHDLDQTLLTTLTSNTGGLAAFALDDGVIRGEALALFAMIRGGGLVGAEAGLSVLGAEGMVETVAGFGTVFDGDQLMLGGRAPAAQQFGLSLSGQSPDEQQLVVETGLLDPTAELTSRANLDPFDRPFDNIVAPLYAKFEADRLERIIDQEGETEERVDEAVRLARTYGVLTRYSSFLALDSDEAWAAAGIERVERDPAGIALGSVDGSNEDEARIGGAGPDEGALEPGGYDDGYGCSDRSVPGGPWPVASSLLLLGGAALVRRRRT